MANTTLKVRNSIATKTTTEWETENPILLKGEMGYDSTSKRYKIGDGVNNWKNLEYTTINGKSKLTLFKSSTKTNQYDGTADLTIVPSDVVGAMEDGTYDVTDNTEFITSNVNGFNYSGSVNVPYRRKATHIWNWIRNKINSDWNVQIKRTQMIYGTDWVRDLSKNPFDVAYNKFINQSFLKNMPLNAVNFYISFDNGTTWRDFCEVRTDVTKEKLVGYIFNLSDTGNGLGLNSSFNSNENKWYRIDIQVGNYAYFEASQFMFYGSYNGISNPTIHLLGHRNEKYTGTKPTEEWTEFFSNRWTGWSGWNSYGFKAIVFGATSGALYDKLRIELRGDVYQGESNYKFGPGLARFMLFGPVVYGSFWNNKSDINLSYNGDMTFPAKITTTGVKIPNGTASQVLLANGTTNTLKTIGGNALLGTGDIVFKTINNQALIGSGNISIEDSHDVALNDINEDGLEWYLVPVCNDNVGIDNLNTTYLYAKNSTQPDENRFLYNRELNAISCNIYASEYDNSIIDVTNNNRSIDFRSIVNILYRENIAYIYSLDDFQNWLITLNGSNATPTKSISTMISEGIAKVVANAPASFDTLKEIADWISTHQNDASAMNTAINNNTTNITNLTTEVNTNTTNISANANQIHGIKGDITSINSVLQSLTNEINNLKTELQNAKAEIAYLKSIAPVVTAEDGFYVVDANDYIGFKVDNNGATDSATTIETTNLDE